MTTGEQAVRNYLTYLADPGALTNVAEIKKLEAAAAKATDVMERLRALSAVHNAKHVDADRLRADFVRHVRAWAAEQQLAVSAFIEFGVANDVLQEAGLLGGARRGRAPRAATSSSRRAPRVGADDIRTAILAQAEPFTIGEIQAGVGGSPGTIKKVLDELRATATVEKLGPVADWAGRGRAPFQYARTDS